jgi:hypothetical protein
MSAFLMTVALALAPMAGPPVAGPAAAAGVATDTANADTMGADADTASADADADTGPVWPDGQAGAAAGESGAADVQAGDGFDFPVRLSGSARMVTEGYLSHGIDPRRPGARWRMMLSPRATLLGEISMSADLLISTEQTEFDQNISQIGLNPSWKWVTLHIGDFSRNYTRYTVQGVRVRGGGVDLRPGDFLVSIQGGRLLRSGAPDGGTVHERTMLAARLGYGEESGTHVRLTLVGGRDGFDEQETGLPDPDTLLLDTMPRDLRPEVATQPEEGVTMGLDGGIELFDRLITVDGEVAASLINRNRRSDVVDISSLDLGVPGPVTDVLTGIQEPRASATADYAWNVEAAVRQGGARLRGRYEYVGPGFGSLGLPYLVGDRKGYRVDGGMRFLDDALGVQARYQHRTNNLASQRRNTVDRQTVSSSVNLRAGQAWTAIVTGIYTTTVNDAASDSVRLDNASTTLVTNLVHQRELFGKASTINLSYNFQRTTDGRAGAPVPVVMTHQVQTSVQVPFTETLSGAPSVSGVFTTGDGIEDRTDLFLGFNGTGRFLDGDLRTSAGVSTTVSRGRQIFNANIRAIYPIGWGTDLVARFRQAEYGAIGDRPAFGESFLTLSVSRSF